MKPLPHTIATYSVWIKMVSQVSIFNMVLKCVHKVSLKLILVIFSICDECNVEIANSEALREHMKVHTVTRAVDSSYLI